MTRRVTRRAVLGAFGTLTFAGCLAVPGADEATDSPTPVTPIREATAGEPTVTNTPGGSEPESPVTRPADCPEPPDVAGLPDRPDELDRASTTAFVEQYERTLALARNPSFVGFSRFEHVRTGAVDSGYAVYLYVVPDVATPTPAGDGSPSTTNDGTPTPTPGPTPVQSDSYSVGYYVDAHRLVRDERPDALTYQFAPYDGFDPRDEGQLVACW
jgi:hypothetical protein